MGNDSNNDVLLERIELEGSQLIVPIIILMYHQYNRSEVHAC